MGLFGNKHSLSDVIRCDLDDYLIWKWSPNAYDAKKRENSIRCGSKLRVKDGEVAVFVYPQKGGAFQDYIEGPFDETIKTSNFPILSGILGAAFGGNSPFQAEIYFINLSGVIQVKFGVPYFDVFDPRYLDFAVPVAVRGSLNIKISDYKAFIKLHRLIDFDLQDFELQIRDAVVKYIKGIVANIPQDNQIPVMQLERKIIQVNDIVTNYLKPRLESNYGVILNGLDISAIEINKDSTGYIELKAITSDITSQTVQAQAAVNIKNLEDTQKINAENMSETLKLQREQLAYAQKLQAESNNLQAHQLNQQTVVSLAGANALGQIGANSAINVGSGGNFNPISMMAGMAIGGAVGQNMAGMMNNMMGTVGQQQPVPPPMPSIKYFIGVNGQASGPFDLTTLAQMASDGRLQPSTMVWKEGMSQWAEASSIHDLASLFTNSSSIPPLMN